MRDHTSTARFGRSFPQATPSRHHSVSLPSKNHFTTSHSLWAHLFPERPSHSHPITPGCTFPALSQSPSISPYTYVWGHHSLTLPQAYQLEDHWFRLPWRLIPIQIRATSARFLFRGCPLSEVHALRRWVSAHLDLCHQHTTRWPLTLQTFWTVSSRAG